MRESKIFLGFHIFLLMIVLIGFGRSYYLRDWFLSRPLDSALRIHGLFLTAWFGWTVLQGYLIVSGRRLWHRHAAWFAGFIAMGVVLSAAWINTRLAMDLRSPQDPENMFIWGNYLTLLAFAVLLVAAIASRRDPQRHRRLILLASIAIIGPAFARFAFWPAFGYGLAAAPLFAGGGLLALFLIIVGHDWLILRKLHSATVGGIAIIVLALVVGVGLGASGLGFKVLNQLHITAAPGAVN